MKFRPVVLVISVVANVALALAVTRQNATTAEKSSKPEESTPVHSFFKHRASKKISPASVENTAPDAAQNSSTAIPFDWSQIESADYKDYIAKLRAFGVPERVVRDIIMADVNKMYRPKFAALRPPKKPKNEKFWENRFGWNGPDADMSKEQREQTRALQKEQKELIQELLGKNVYQEIAKDSGYEDSSERQFGNLTPEQREKVDEMQQRYWEVSGEIHRRAQGYFDQDMQAELHAAQKKMIAELGTVLSPEQVKEYELRTSDIANNMRWQLSGFDPDEKEFRAIFDYKQASQDLDDLRSRDPDTPAPTKEEVKAMQDKRQEVEKSFADALGADRLKDYKMMEDWPLKNMLDSGVPKASVVKVSDMKDEAQKAASKVRNDKSLSQEQKTAALQAIRTETKNTLNDLLGERRAKAYVGNGGWWLNNIAPVSEVRSVIVR